VITCTAIINRARQAGFIIETASWQDIDEGYYKPIRDRIVLGKTTRIDTLLHELAHATGHPTRLNRPAIRSTIHDKDSKLGSDTYKEEELVAWLVTRRFGRRLGFSINVQKYIVGKWTRNTFKRADKAYNYLNTKLGFIAEDLG
jgi:antirestriction protein ArdC